jgi:hypothetical protein
MTVDGGVVAWDVTVFHFLQQWHPVSEKLLAGQVMMVEAEYRDYTLLIK